MGKRLVNISKAEFKKLAFEHMRWYFGENPNGKMVLGASELCNGKYTGLELMKAKIENVTFKNSKFKLCNFNKAKFYNCNFEDCFFVGCTMENATFTNCTFKFANMNDVSLKNSRVDECNMNHLFMFNININNTKFVRTSLAYSHIGWPTPEAKGVIFNECNLNNFNIVGADESDFYGAVAAGCSVYGTGIGFVRKLDIKSPYVTPVRNKIAYGYIRLDEKYIAHVKSPANKHTESGSNVGTFDAEVIEVVDIIDENTRKVYDGQVMYVYSSNGDDAVEHVQKGTVLDAKKMQLDSYYYNGFHLYTDMNLLTTKIIY